MKTGSISAGFFLAKTQPTNCHSQIGFPGPRILVVEYSIRRGGDMAGCVGGLIQPLSRST